jgi:CHAD domain-containing protein
MKQNISGRVNKHFKIINKLYRQIINSFEIESVHEFRTEIKKLRAFLRLLNVEINDDVLKIPKPLKLFYSYAGTIRNLQLQLKNISDKENSALTITNIYIDYLHKIIEKWETRAIEFSYSKKDFSDDEKKLRKRLPGKLRRASIKKYMRNKMNEFAILLKELPGENILHSIRKLLKDILYNWKFIKPYKKMLPSYLSKKEKIRSFTELIGLLLDKYTGVNLLETYLKDSEENGSFTEKDISDLQKIESAWKNELQELSQKIYSKLSLS